MRVRYTSSESTKPQAAVDDCQTWRVVRSLSTSRPSMSKMTARGRVPSERCIGLVRCNEGVCCARKRYSTARNVSSSSRDKIVAHRCRYDGACAPRRRPSSPSFSSRPRPLRDSRDPTPGSGHVGHGARPFGGPTRSRTPERLHIHRAPPRRESRRTWESVRRTAADVRGLPVSGSERKMQATHRDRWQAHRSCRTPETRPRTRTGCRRRDTEAAGGKRPRSRRGGWSVPSGTAAAAAILEDAFKVFEPTIVARETMQGRHDRRRHDGPPHARVTTREGGWMKEFHGRAWFQEEDGQFARLEVQAIDDVSVGWGLVGRLHKGSRIVVERQRLGRQWLPGGSRSRRAAGRCCSGRSI